MVRTKNIREFAGNFEFPLKVILISKIPGNSGNKASMEFFIFIPNIPGNGGNLASVEVSIPIPNIPGSSGTEKGHLCFTWSSLL